MIVVVVSVVVLSVSLTKRPSSSDTATSPTTTSSPSYSDEDVVESSGNDLVGTNDVPTSVSASPTASSSTTNPEEEAAFRPIVPDVLNSNGCYEMECLTDSYLQHTRDRLGHNAPMFKGQALCNGDEDRYPGVLFQFGLTYQGALVWQNCSSLDPTESRRLILHNASAEDASIASLPTDKVWFQMTEDATWQIQVASQSDNSELSVDTVWEHAVQNQNQVVQASPRCLGGRPVLDCPYIHFRRHGDVIMNYIAAGTGAWVACKSRKICYPDLFVE